ncbi:hypothetical protein N8250_01895 [Gammaproteobacteria bacterium]|nr:hypothetical protein [Gammaproteobacteria bacterium]
METLGFTFGIMGMSLGTMGFIFGIMCLKRMGDVEVLLYEVNFSLKEYKK